MGFTGICREPNKIKTPKKNGSACFIPSTVIKHARICDCMGSAHTSEKVRTVQVASLQSRSPEQNFYLIQDLCSHILCGYSIGMDKLSVKSLCEWSRQGWLFWRLL